MASFIVSILLGLAASWQPLHAQPAQPLMVLESDAYAASATCWNAFRIVDSADGRVTQFEQADALWFLVNAARLQPARGPVVEQVIGLVRTLSPGDPALTANADDLKDQCAARWPASVSLEKITLPADRFESAGICHAVAQILLSLGGGEEYALGNTYAEYFLNPILEKTDQALNDAELGRRNINSPDQLLKMQGVWLARAGQLGGLNSVVAECGVYKF